jgi:hypothetical protein
VDAFAPDTTDTSRKEEGQIRELLLVQHLQGAILSLTKSQILASNLYLCGTGPLFGQCIFGVKTNCRDIAQAGYIDRYLFATQLEYRLVLLKRFGLVGFGGVGEIAPSVGQFNYDNLLLSIGTGLRFLLDKKYHVNLRANIAEGKTGPAWSMGVGEDF